MDISKSGLQSGNPLELLKFAWLLNAEKLKSEFDKVQVAIEKEEDLFALSEISKKKFDVEGKIKDENGNPLMFDTMRIINGIKYSAQEKEKAKTFNYIP